MMRINWALRSCLLALVATGIAMPAFATPSEPEVTVQRRIAITIDDLPWASLGDAAPAQLEIYHARLVTAMREAKAPVTGFVNEGKLVSNDKVETSRVHLLRDWLQAGMDLGNHTLDHSDLHAVGLEAYESAILRGETFLRPLLAERGKVPVWFRHPYLRAGRTAADKAALQKFLEAHGYRIAPVTVDTSDWVWAGAYRKALAANDVAVQQKLRDEYVPYMLRKIDYFEQQSVQLLGYNLPQILLMHANEINADCYAALVEGIATRGYQFIDLEQAMQDPAYQRVDAYTGRWGPSWLHRWAIAENRPKEFFAGEPRVDAWVLQLAGIDSE